MSSQFRSPVFKFSILAVAGAILFWVGIVLLVTRDTPATTPVEPVSQVIRPKVRPPSESPTVAKSATVAKAEPPAPPSMAMESPPSPPDVSSLLGQAVDWESMPRDDTGASMGSRANDFTFAVADQLRSMLRDCVSQLSPDREHVRHMMELRVRPAPTGVLIEQTILDPAELDAHLRKCIASKMDGFLLKIEPTEELGTPKRVGFPIKF